MELVEQDDMNWHSLQVGLVPLGQSGLLTSPAARGRSLWQPTETWQIGMPQKRE
jgi:hypothetical protein